MMRRLFAWLNRRPAPSGHEVPHQLTVNGIPLSTTEPTVVDAKDLYPDGVGTVTFTPVCLTAAAVRDAHKLDDTMAKVDEIINRAGPIDLDDVLAKCGVLTDANLAKARASVDVARAAYPPVPGPRRTRRVIRPAPVSPFAREIAELEAAEVERQAHEDALWVEAITRNEILDDLERHRHRDRTHPATPDTYFWGITVAERVIGGDQP